MYFICGKKMSEVSSGKTLWVTIVWFKLLFNQTNDLKNQSESLNDEKHTCEKTEIQEREILHCQTHESVEF